MRRKGDPIFTFIVFLIIGIVILFNSISGKSENARLQRTQETFSALDPYFINKNAGNKILSYDLGQKSFSTKYVPKARLAKKEQDVGYIVLFQSYWYSNSYTDGSTISTQTLDVKLRDCATGRTIAENTFYSEKAPNSIYKKQGEGKREGKKYVSEQEVMGWVSSTIENKDAILRDEIEAAEDEKHQALEVAQEANCSFPEFCSRSELYTYLTDPENSFIIELSRNLGSVDKIYYPRINRDKPFSEEAAQYALDKLDADYKSNALERVLYDDHESTRYYLHWVLTKVGGFTEEEASYAIENTDFSLNALHQAEEYRDIFEMSKKEIYNKLIEEDDFTQEEAQYAIDNLES